MGSKEDFLELFNKYPAQQPALPKPMRATKEHLSKEHEEMMKLLNDEESLSRELTKKTL